MATKRMLIDATHPEETRVVVINGSRLEDFDVEVASRKQLKGNIYLAKVTRVEPSLQAAFVDYGGNRHGFLSFNEIHPDYYQIPVTDRERILAEHKAQTMAEEAESAGNGEGGENGEEHVETIGGDDSDEVEVRRTSAFALRRQYKIQEVIKRRQILLVQVVKEERGNKGAALTTYLSLAGRYCVLMPNTARGGGISRKISAGADRKRLKSILGELDLPDGMAVIVRTAGAERGKSEIKRDYDYLLRLWDNVRRLTLESIAPTLVYEEGNLIKRAVRDLYDRDIDEIIVDGEDGYRIAREFMRLLTPSHVKRVKRYDDPIMPLFHRYQVESQLDAMHSPVVQLKSGGYIVINPTEALVSIDVNSGRATRERNIEETAMKTNIEASDEIARQLRLRDLAGLVVIDFIDMELPRNRVQVERRLKEAMRTDRARIQLGRISPFGLLELSRQRLRPSLLETSFYTCPHCAGSGLIRSTDSAALQVLRAVEEEGIRRRCGAVAVYTTTPIALYLLNQKRVALGDVESRFGIKIEIRINDTLISPNHLIEWTKPAITEQPETPPQSQGAAAAAGVPAAETTVEEAVSAEEEHGDEEGGRRRRRRRPRHRRREGEPGTAAPAEEAVESAVATPTELEPEPEPEPEPEAADTAGDAETEPEGRGEQEEDADGRSRRRRRGRRGGRRRRGGRGGEADAPMQTQPADETLEPPPMPAPEELPAGLAAELAPIDEASTAAEEAPIGEASAVAESASIVEPAAEPTAEEKPARRRRKPRRPEKATETPTDEPTPTDETAHAAPPPERKRRRRSAKPAAEPSPAMAEATTPEPVNAAAAEPVIAEEPAVAETVEPEPPREFPSEPASAEPVPGPVSEPPEPEPPESEPVSETVAVTVDPLSEAIVHVGSEEAQRPKRRGWWQRLTER